QVGVLFFVALLASCASVPGATVTPTPKTDVKVQLSWVDTIEFAGLYMAESQGYYADQGLNVELQKGGYDSQGNYIDPVQTVLDGQTSFGITGADVILTSRAEGKPLVAIASIYQRSPVALIALSSQNLLHPADLKGKRVATEPGTSLGISYDALLASQHISHSDITEIPRTDFTTQPLLSGEVDVLLSFVTDDAINARNFDKGSTLLLMSDYGIDIYTNVIFTTEDMIKNHPDVVERFVRATVQGLQTAVDDPESAANYVLDKFGATFTTDYRALQQPGMLVSLPLLKPAGNQAGMMQPEKWERIYQILDSLGLLKQSVDVQQAYTLDFLQKAYHQ
ncbi:MAG: ABC transporter substrate-binding protein, partial [Chloroflexota bacterium]